MSIPGNTFGTKGRTAAWIVAGLALTLTLAGCAGNVPTTQRRARPGALPPPERANTIPRPSTDGQVLGGIKHGTDAAGRSMDRAGDAALSGVNRASETVSSPIRRWGESLGRILDKGPGGKARERAN